MADPNRICAYCAEAVLTPDDPPEHVVPHALGASFTVATVCQACNSWASREIDQPFLRDDMVRILRHVHDVRAPGPGRGQRVSNPMFQGVLEDGSRAWMDEDGNPHIRGKIFRDEVTGAVRIQAGSIEEAERLARRVERDAARTGATVQRSEMQFHREQSPEIQSRVMMDLARWARMAAKIALATGSHVFDAGWRTSEEAQQLRHVLRDEPSTLLGDKPQMYPKKVEGELAEMFGSPDHILFFQRDDVGRVQLATVLFGDHLLALPIGDRSREVPDAAWRLNPRRPRVDGTTTFFGLMEPYLAKISERNQAFEDHGPTTI